MPTKVEASAISDYYFPAFIINKYERVIKYILNLRLNYVQQFMSRQTRLTPNQRAGILYDIQIKKYLNGNARHGLPQEIIEIVDRYVAMARAIIDDNDIYQDKVVCTVRQRQPDVVFYGQKKAVMIDWTYSDKKTDHSHRMWRFAKLYDHFGNNCLIWVVSTKNGQIIQKFEAQNLINKMELWCYRILKPHYQQLNRIRRSARETGGCISNHPQQRYRNMTWDELYELQPDQVGYCISTERRNFRSAAIYYALKKLDLFDEGGY